MNEMENIFPQSAPTAIKELLARIITGKKWQHRLQLHGVFSFWDEIVGPDISRQAQPSFIRGRILWVDVTDSIWMQQLHFQKILLLQLINNKLNDLALSDIRFRLNSKLVQKEKQIFSPKAPTRIDEEKLTVFQGQLASLRSDGLRETLVSLWKKNHSNI
jgi:predicted nucleic acid-binding Zn ribbon protein